MGHARSLILLILIILLSISSCNPSSQATPTQLPTSAPISSPTPAKSPTQPPTASPSDTPSVAPTETPAGLNLYLPVGVATTLYGSGQVTFYDLQGLSLSQLQTPNLGTGSYQQAVVAGALTLPPNLTLPPLVFYVYQNGGELWLNAYNNPALLVNAPNLYYMISSPGKPLISYSLVEYADSGLRSLLYLSDLQSLPTAQPILDNTNTEIYAIKPLAIALDKDQPSGVWYTTVPYGIGGDIVFEPRASLNFYDIVNQRLTTPLSPDEAPVGISPDQTWIAATPSGSIGPLKITHNLDFANSITIPLRDDSDRGAGEAVFSPDNQYIAWKEASGSIANAPSNFHQTIRIASMDGALISEIADSSFTDVSGFGAISWVIPVGWLDTQTLVLEVRGQSMDAASLLTVKFDGTGISHLADGLFIGFLYP